MENKNFADVFNIQAEDEKISTRIESLKSIEELIDFLSSAPLEFGEERKTFFNNEIDKILDLIAKNKKGKIDDITEKYGIRKKVGKLIEEMYKYN